jgi:hypothetical protein
MPLQLEPIDTGIEDELISAPMIIGSPHMMFCLSHSSVLTNITVTPESPRARVSPLPASNKFPLLHRHLPSIASEMRSVSCFC